MPNASTLPTSVHGERTELLKPLHPIASLPRATDIRSLRAALKKNLGMSDAVAGSVSTIFTDPAKIIGQVANPTRKRVPGGYVTVLNGQVFTARLAPDPFNPRNSDRVRYKVSGKVSGLPMITAVPGGPGEMELSVPSRDALIEQLDWTRETTVGRNEPYPPIAEQGIMDAPYGVVTTVHYANGEADSVHVFVREGSSRVAMAHKLIGLHSEDVLFRYPGAARHIQAHIDELNGYAAMPADEIGTEEAAALRCGVVEFELIVGVEPDVPNGLDLGQAVKARVSQDHLNAKTEWSEASQHSTLGDDCLRALVDAGTITEKRFEWVSGRLSAKESVAGGFTAFPDERAAQAIYMFTTNIPKYHESVRKPIALVLTKDPNGRRSPRVAARDKLPVAVEMIAREMSGTETEVKRFRTVLEKALPIDISTRKWQPSTATPEALYKGAVGELKADKVGGKCGTELLVRAAYYLAKYGSIAAPRNDEGPGGDRRAVREVLSAMLESEHGLLVLRQAVEDGRNRVEPRLVDSKGDLVEAAGGGDVVLTNIKIRTSIAPREGYQPKPKTTTPADKFQTKFRQLRADVRSVGNTVRALGEMTNDNGSLLVDTTEVLSPSQIKSVVAELRTVVETLTEWRETSLDLREAEADDDFDDESVADEDVDEGAADADDDGAEEDS